MMVGFSHTTNSLPTALRTLKVILSAEITNVFALEKGEDVLYKGNPGSFYTQAKWHIWMNGSNISVTEAKIVRKLLLEHATIQTASI